MARTRRTIVLAVATALVATGGAFALRELGRSEASYVAMHEQAPALTGAEFLHGGHGHAGASALLGRRQVSGFEVRATQVGALRGSVLGTFEFTASRAPLGAELTAWVGTRQQSRIAQPATIRVAGSTAHAHLDLPPVVTPDTKLWVEVATPTGTREVVSFDLAE